MEDGKKQYLYMLRLKPSLAQGEKWTEAEEKAVEEHFQRLEKLLEEGTLIMAGRTQTMDEKTFGIVILETETEEEAYVLMETDPAVAEGVMTAELFPYKVALMRK